ncbi:MAG: glycosyltransferase family 9 protein [Phycisphaerales bacterium]|nr:glycosyltransferase family 9 protein [Planctomycetota bacterium]
MADPSRILIIRPSALGDVCRTVPALASLRARFPGATIDWLVQDAFADAIRHHPALSGVVEFRRRELGRALRSGRSAPLREFLRSLRDRNYELVYDLQGLFRSGFFAWATKAPRRVGLANARELGWLGLSERYHVPMEMHSVDRMLEVIQRSGVPVVKDMQLFAPPDAVSRLALDGEIAKFRFAILSPTSRWAAKRWPQARFAAIARSLLELNFERVVLVGAPDEREQCAELINLSEVEPRIVDRIGRTSIADLMALTQASSLVIANDSAVLHMAVGFGRPLIALYGPTDVSRVGPYQRSKDVLQHLHPGESPSHKDSSGSAFMERISISEVLDRVRALQAAVA